MSGLEQAQPQDPPQPRPSLGVPARPARPCVMWRESEGIPLPLTV